MPLRRFCLFALLLCCALPAFAQPDTRPLALKIAAANERFWDDTAEPKANVTSRGLFAYAFVLCEANQNLERLDHLFDVAAQMQDRDPNSKSYGNFRWKWDDTQIVDYNAVDFSMRGGSLLWLKHRDMIPATAREKLRVLLDCATEGCLRHKVSESYTNIALMNAGDLILLGEALEKPKVADEGYRRLERTLLTINETGVHEYVSSTYYGTDLDDLTVIEAFAKRERGVAQARALLDLFWHDIALNWFPPAQKLAGAQSRNYDYLRGLGYLDTQLQLNGWLDGESRDIDAIYGVQAKWHPSAELKALSTTYPRLVQQKWGVEDAQWRTHFVQSDVTLSTAGATYGGRMDFPLTVDFPGPRQSMLSYFTSDARSDPYGKILIAESATHSKALHLNPFWTAAQNKGDALGLVVYRDKDIPPDTQTLESHFVMPLDNDGVWVGDRQVKFEAGKSAAIPLPVVNNSWDSVVVHKGSAALMVRVLWASPLKDGDLAPVQLIYDGNPYGAIRLTVTHYRGPALHEITPSKSPVGALFAVSVASGVENSPATRAALRNRFKDPLVSQVNNLVSAVEVQTPNGPLKMAITPTYAAQSEPRVAPVVLALNGDDIGRKILQTVEPIKSSSNGGATPLVPLTAKSGTYFEAESARVFPVFEIGEDAAASGGKFVWAPGEPGQGGGGALGSATWNLQSAQSGEVTLWGRVLAPTPDDDSFFLRLQNDGRDVLPPATWALGTHPQWEWVRFDQKLTLPAGQSTLQLRVREDGAKIDRLFLTRDATETPK